MNKIPANKLLIALTFLVLPRVLTGQITIDHTCTDITRVPQWAIDSARSKLHIAYAHTSHGSQITEGMRNLVAFANDGGKGLNLAENSFIYSNGGYQGSLDLHDGFTPGDAGYFPLWYNSTIAYLEKPENADVNVVMWAWCGQVGEKYQEDSLWLTYLLPMSQLEAAYPQIKFVYMTGHLDFNKRLTTNPGNDSIRSFCRNNHKVMYDFADIESYGPDGTCYKYNGSDNCSYYSPTGDSLGNWAVDYQNSHTEGVDWYNCLSRHSQPYNANLKAYAAWWLYATLAGWTNWFPTSLEEGNPETEGETPDAAGTEEPKLEVVSENPATHQVCLQLNHPTKKTVFTTQLIDTYGRIHPNCIQTESFSETSSIVVKTRGLSAGIYYVWVQYGKQVLTQKIIVI